ncbi:hypothetical protein ASPBRDRAFT_77323 [Aspergillus brasiliensis CBS 101740]|uniref:Fungal-type protein kinase domain-containing protein n=1 Tax=Aspergillus brasiliensis (strain CBS 101740 / IMI 381727 / IBT 21946) TaxID=767769 RepID=A0A1L9UBP0_ASPBC|nr:hypothetical protein ASPBRDRAFT_77323 [Aspergillus brasiliensis CBS 101740]
MSQSKEHQARRHAIEAVAQAISSRRENRYQHKDLENLSVKILPMPLSANGEPLFEPEYFCPYKRPIPEPKEEIDFSPSSPKEVMDPLDETMVLSDYFHYYLSSLIIFEGIEWQHSPRQTVDFPCILFEIYLEKSLDWRVDGITEIPGGPRMKCTLVESVNADDDQITRGEIISMCRIMITCLGPRVYRAHQVSPVLLISFVGPRHARILLGHHDGTNLVIRQSKRFAFWERNVHDLEILLRWWCSSGVGDTING